MNDRESARPAAEERGVVLGESKQSDGESLGAVYRLPSPRRSDRDQDRQERGHTPPAACAGPEAPGDVGVHARCTQRTV